MLRDEPGWRSHRRLIDAQRAGLISPVRDYQGISWADLYEAADRFAQPLIDAGWLVTDRTQDSHNVLGDTILIDLRRGDEAFEIERYENGNVTLRAVDDEALADDEAPADPLLDQGTPTEAINEIRARGWLP